MHSNPTPLKVLFLCTGNSCRSQMAEGWARHLMPGVIEPYSAGTAPQDLNPLAVRVMQEAGVDISAHRAKALDDLAGVNFDYVITICSDADKNCPVFPGSTIRIHHSFDDPPRLAESARNEDEALVHYRRIRDEISRFVETLPESLAEAGPWSSGS